MFPPTLDKPLSSVCAQSQPEGCCCSLQSPPGILRPPDCASAASRTSLRAPNGLLPALPVRPGPPASPDISCPRPGGNPSRGAPNGPSGARHFTSAARGSALACCLAG